MSPKGDGIEAVSDYWESSMTEGVFGHPPNPILEIQIDRLRKPRQVDDDQDGLFVVITGKGEHYMVGRRKQLKIPVTERRETFANSDYSTHPPEEGGQIRFLNLHIDCLIVEFGIDINR